MTKRTFASIPEKHASSETASVVLIPVPYDGTSTWGKGADKGPKALLDAADNMELYDIETDSEPYTFGIHLDDPLTDYISPEEMVDTVQDRVSHWINRNKIVGLIGGEHSVSIGSIKAFHETHRDLNVLHIDAHADLRPEYEGSPFNHACAVHWASRRCKLIQVGIRSMDISEKEYMNEDHVFFADDIFSGSRSEWLSEVLDLIDGPLYITFDLDALDPSAMPATGTPEPGGFSWYEALDLLREVITRKKVVGFDIVELAPRQGSQASEFTAAKLLYKMIAYLSQND